MAKGKCDVCGKPSAGEWCGACSRSMDKYLEQACPECDPGAGGALCQKHGGPAAAAPEKPKGEELAGYAVPRIEDALSFDAPGGSLAGEALRKCLAELKLILGA